MTQIQTTSGTFIERKERRIYLADKCPVHGIRYQSFSKRKLKMGCRKCRSNSICKNQILMFGVDFGGKDEQTSVVITRKCNCGGQHYNGREWVGDHLIGCPMYK